MWRLLLLLTLFRLTLQFGNAQDTTLLVAGPMLGYLEHREALIWLQVTPAVSSIEVKYYPKNHPSNNQTIKYAGTLGEAYNPEKIVLADLAMNTQYAYEIYLNHKK